MKPLVSLLDVNVLIALSWRKHVFHAPVSAWMRENRSHGWATCPMTQAGFVRVSAQIPTTVAMNVRHAVRLLQENCGAADHVFWAQGYSVTDMTPEIRDRLVGPQQVTDALLLDLAIRNGGRLVTLDSRVSHLLPAGSSHRAAIEVIPLEQTVE